MWNLKIDGEWLRLKLNRPTFQIQVYEVFGESKAKYWKVFAKHHYLDSKLNRAARCWVAENNGQLVAFNSALPMPSGTLKNAYREHRLVVLSDFQGMGIGTSLSECIGRILISEGKRFYSKTVNPKLGEYRNKNSSWRATSKNGIARKKEGLNKNFSNKSLRLGVVCYSHEYTGQTS